MWMRVGDLDTERGKGEDGDLVFGLYTEIPRGLLHRYFPMLGKTVVAIMMVKAMKTTPT